MAAKKKAAKKSAARKSSAKRSVKKVAKRSTAKRSAKKSVKKKSKSTARYSIPSVPVSGSGRSSVSTISTTPKPSSGSSYSSKSTKSSDAGSSKGIVIAVVLGILILAIAVISRGSDSESTTVTPTPAASESVAPTEEPTSAPLAAHEPPAGIVSLYNATGATVNWKAPAASEGITGYNIELRDNGVGEWKLVATVPATQFKQQIVKNDETGWVQVKVSTVYSDGVVSEGKVHGLPGSWS
uniref:fibronectin type III domain-containing protein n=1 Tax=Candidatus Nanopelagicus sp. TaxID=2518620 RepID=UPI00404A9E1A